VSWRWAGISLIGLGLGLLSGCMPDGIARTSCTDEMLATADPWHCTVSGARIDQASSIEFDTESRNHVAKVKIALAVARGTLRVGYRDLEGDRRLTITPDAPALVETRTRLHRERRSFTLSFEPVGGVVEGLTGTVDYSTP
jgi:hypothetical protein